jgi:hypothetical protein
MVTYLYLQREELRGDWKLHNLHSLPNLIRMVKSSRMGGMGHVACIISECTQRLGRENFKERNGTEDLGTDVSIMLKWILQTDH